LNYLPIALPLQDFKADVVEEERQGAALKIASLPGVGEAASPSARKICSPWKNQAWVDQPISPNLSPLRINGFSVSVMARLARLKFVSNNQPPPNGIPEIALKALTQATETVHREPDSQFGQKRNEMAWTQDKSLKLAIHLVESGQIEESASLSAEGNTEASHRQKRRTTSLSISTEAGPASVSVSASNTLSSSTPALSAASTLTPASSSNLNESVSAQLLSEVRSAIFSRPNQSTSSVIEALERLKELEDFMGLGEQVKREEG